MPPPLNATFSSTTLIIAVVTILSFLYVSSSILQKPSTSLDPDKPDNIVDFTLADSPTEIVLLNGETLTIKLKENPSTGYLWYCGSDDENNENQNIHLSSDRYDPDSSSREIIGAGGVRVFRFTVLDDTTLLCSKRRPWETNDPLQAISLKIMKRG